MTLFSPKWREETSQNIQWIKVATFVDFLDSFALPLDVHDHQSTDTSLIDRVWYKNLNFFPSNMKTLVELSTIFIEMSTRTENDMSDALDGRDTEIHARASLYRQGGNCRHTLALPSVLSLVLARNTEFLHHIISSLSFLCC